MVSLNRVEDPETTVKALDPPATDAVTNPVAIWVRLRPTIELAGISVKPSPLPSNDPENEPPKSADPSNDPEKDPE